MEKKDSLPNYKFRKIVLFNGTGLVTGVSLGYLNQIWYKQYPKVGLHAFDDNSEWLQMDKCGHTFTNFQLSGLMIKTFKWAGFSKKKQLFIGGMLGFSYMTVVELMDGFSGGWGFSWGDMIANASGTALSISQYALWDEARINLKFSYWPTTLPHYSPNLLGKTNTERLLKDYNGQTYWLSVSPFAFCKSDMKVPRWLAVSFGYGADGMLGANYNNFAVIDDEGNVKNFDRVRQYYFSLDVDFTKIRTRSKILKTIFSGLNLLKLPFPTLEFQNGKTKFHSIYF